ncbi:MAG TPA: bifunctional UDP-N-acetylglucosamine diphosphorylase/glucosamine-1-phosphate N-acetyltransferase GlmU [Alphaproteobacteria bacterium]|nr:bifunctional UDP-N-acetylglucosamine diphosphorylase/glucosamine-1-phosphate N-acetyltransferase GlmU [Rhodospirillaceae bacterium]HRJ12228.1 bifunctional UDP-N-acetylglucosamine diphosphorylase/glucosamine-1-phosphate N-acetyltransferase GlmU [Alphaproteobacteria bacterium]
MTESNLAIVILAAGKGTRMQSSLPKVLHKVAGLPMLGHVVRTAESLSPQKIIIVAAPDQVETFRPLTGTHEIAVQSQQLGTGHAVRCTENALKNFSGDILVLYGDVPLIRANVLQEFIAAKHKANTPLAVMGFRTLHAYGFGRLVTDGDKLLEIIEQKDLPAEHANSNGEENCNSGIMCISSSQLWPWLQKLQTNNAQGEYYLTDIAKIACHEDKNPIAYFVPGILTQGVNDRFDLSKVEVQYQKQRSYDFMMNAVTLLSPTTVTFSYDTQIAPDVIIGANVVFGPGVVIESGAEILPFSHLEGCTVRSGARIGPFARIRPGATIGQNARIGNFVEIKNAQFGDGAKANHLSYIGDATVGADANIGAGTITCNYDGIKKSRTEIGTGAFIGSNSALVAPVSIGEGAMVAAGSVITKDVESGALGLARATQKNIAHWAKEFFSKGKI